MKFLGVLLAIFAASCCVRANPEGCTEERGDACVSNLLRYLRNWGDEENLCRELIRSVDCLKEAVDDCLGERNSAMDDVFEALDKLLGKCKAIDDEVTEIEKCYEQNEDYIMECVHKVYPRNREDEEDDDKKCETYQMMYDDCYVHRIREKCGDKAGDREETRVSDVSWILARSCKGSRIIETIFVFRKDMRK